MSREHEGGAKSGEHSGGGAAGRDDRQHQTAMAAGIQQRRQAAANHYNQAHPEEVADFTVVVLIDVDHVRVMHPVPRRSLVLDLQAARCRQLVHLEGVRQRVCERIRGLRSTDRVVTA